MIKEETQNILNKIDAIPKSKDKQVEFDNLAPLIWELKLLLTKYGKEFENLFVDMNTTESSERILPIVCPADYNNSAWKQYKEKMKKLNDIHKEPVGSN